jgi:superfamily II RNA helicase
MMDPSFSLYISHLFAKWHLERIIFDECHTIVGDWQPAMRSIARVLQSCSVQFVFMSTTLPNYMIGRLCERMNIQESQTQVLRASTERKGISH